MSHLVALVAAGYPRGAPLRAAGFTLVELVSVMVLIGVLAAVATPRFFATEVFAANGYAAELRAAIRHAQAVALASGCATRVVVDATGLRLQRWRGGTDCNDRSGVAETIGRPGGDTYDIRAPRDVDASPGDFSFDGFGRPHAANGSAIDTVLALDVGTQRITIQPDTGLVE